MKISPPFLLQRRFVTAAIKNKFSSRYGFSLPTLKGITPFALYFPFVRVRYE